MLRHADKPPISRSTGLGRAQHPRECLIKEGLLAEQPADEAGRRRRVRAAKPPELCRRVRSRAGEHQRRRDRDQRQNRANALRALAGDHGQVTVIVLAKLAPMPILASEVTSA